MQLLAKFLCVILVTSATSLSAGEINSARVLQAQPSRTINGYDVAIDVVLRPIGFVGMVAGTALYVGLSPLTAISQAFEPHDSFAKLGKLLVVQPAKYTFARPVGDYAYESSY